jgi:hypothetical protein
MLRPTPICTPAFTHAAPMPPPLEDKNCAGAGATPSSHSASETFSCSKLVTSCHQKGGRYSTSPARRVTSHRPSVYPRPLRLNISDKNRRYIGKSQSQPQFHAAPAVRPSDHPRHPEGPAASGDPARVPAGKAGAPPRPPGTGATAPSAWRRPAERRGCAGHRSAAARCSPRRRRTAAPSTPPRCLNDAPCPLFTRHGASIT